MTCSNSRFIQLNQVQFFWELLFNCNILKNELLFFYGLTCSNCRFVQLSQIHSFEFITKLFDLIFTLMAVVSSWSSWSFLHWHTSIINTGRLKPINIWFDTRWNWISEWSPRLYGFFYFVRQVLFCFYTTSVSNIVMHTITKVHMSAKSMISNTWNLLPAWVSKPRRQQKKKKHNKTSNGAGQHAKKLCASKISYFN